MTDGGPDQGRIEQLQRALSETRGYANSSDGSVRVEVGANGTLHGIHLAEHSAVHTARELVSMLADLHRDAASDAASAVRDVLTALGDGVSVQSAPPDVDDNPVKPGGRAKEVPQRVRPVASSTPKPRRSFRAVDAAAAVGQGTAKADTVAEPEHAVLQYDYSAPWGDPAPDPGDGIASLLPEDHSLEFLIVDHDWSELPSTDL